MTQKRKRKWDMLSMIRYAILAILIIYIGVLMTVKGGSSASFQSVSEAVEKAADISGMTKGGERELRRYYGLNAKDFEDVSFYYTNQTMGVEEILIVKTETEGDIQAVEDAVQNRLEAQIDNFEGYGAKQMRLLRNASRKTRGSYLFFAVSPNAEKFEKAFVKSL